MLLADNFVLGIGCVQIIPTQAMSRDTLFKTPRLLIIHEWYSVLRKCSVCPSAKHSIKKNAKVIELFFCIYFLIHNLILYIFDTFSAFFAT